MTASGLSAEDTIALHELVHQYAHIVDDADFERPVARSSRDDVEFDTSAFGNPPLRGLRPSSSRTSGRGTRSRTTSTTAVVSTDPDGTVRVRSKVLSLLAGGLCGSGTYDDVAVRTPDGWRISEARDRPAPRARPAPAAAPPGRVIAGPAPRLDVFG